MKQLVFDRLRGGDFSGLGDFMNRDKVVEACRGGVVDKVLVVRDVGFTDGVVWELEEDFVVLDVFGDILVFLRSLDWSNIFDFKWWLGGMVEIVFHKDGRYSVANERKGILDVVGVCYSDGRLSAIEYSPFLYVICFERGAFQYRVWFNDTNFEQVLGLIKSSGSLGELSKAVSLLYSAKEAGVVKVRSKKW
ncbi:MAG: hypothetical protein QXI58_01905 [Candidatus Micrarchaeia archaeon]